MIITKAYAKKLIRQDKARETGHVQGGYMAIERLDLHRVDHYLVDEGTK